MTFIAVHQEARADIAAVFTVVSPEMTLKTWTPADLQKLKKGVKREKDPQSGKVVAWEGPLLQDFIEKSLEGLELAKKAQVDLIVLKDAAGGEALIPRSFVTKYPLILANRRDHQALPGFESVVPWTSQPKSVGEELPVERYFLPNVVRIEFGNYREKYATAFLSRRTDPSAMKGEKIYVQSCLSCHSSGGPSQASIGAKARNVAASTTAHPAVKGLPKMDDRSRRALLNYLDELKSETPGAAAPAAAHPQASN